MKNKDNNKMIKETNKPLEYNPTQADLTHAIRKADLKYAELTEKLKGTKTKDKGTLQMVQERAIAAVDKHFYSLGYYGYTEDFPRGPIDKIYKKSVYNVETGQYEPKVWNIDVKGINPNANYKPAFKPRSDKKFLERDKSLNRIVAIEYNGTIKFIPGYLESYKNLKDLYITIDS